MSRNRPRLHTGAPTLKDALMRRILAACVVAGNVPVRLARLKVVGCRATWLLAGQTPSDFGQVLRADGSRVGFKGGDLGAYRVKASAIRAVSPAFRKWLNAWQARVAASERRSVKVTPTLAQLSVVVRERAVRLSAWANANAGCWRTA